MARLANTANFGYVPIPEEAATAIGTFFQLPDAGTIRLCDPCAGEGRALELISAEIGVDARQRYGCEIHDGRFEAAKERISNMVQADTLTELQASGGAFQMAYINPPFDIDSAENGGGRVEIKFLQRVIEKGGWVQIGGTVVIVVPQYVMARPDFVKHLAKVYDDMRIFRLPDDIRRYGEAIFFGVVRKSYRTGEEREAEITRLGAVLADDLPVLEAQAQPLYTLPQPQRLKSKLRWQNGNKATAAGAQHEVVMTGGAWTSEEYRRARQIKAKRLNPRFPLHPGQRVFRIAAGEINGRVITIAGVPHVIKGSTVEEIITETEDKSSTSAEVTEHRVIRRQVPCITAVSQTDGTIRQFTGASGIATLLADPDVSQELSDAVTDAAPPTYQLDMDDWMRNFLESIVPKKALPGYKPGILPMQQHVIAAGARAMSTHDEAWGKTPSSIILAADMGCGKTTMGMLMAHAMVLKLTGQYQAFEQAQRYITVAQTLANDLAAAA